MADNLFKQVGTFEYPQLLADASGHIKESVVLAPGSGDIARGTVLICDSAGFYAPAESADITPTAMMAIADEAAATGTETTGVGIPIAAYKKGIFLKRYIVLKGGAEPSLMNLAVMSNAGLMVRQSISAAGEHAVFDAEK